MIMELDEIERVRHEYRRVLVVVEGVIVWTVTSTYRSLSRLKTA